MVKAMGEPIKVSVFTPNNDEQVFNGRRRRIIFSVVFFLFKSKWQELKQKFSQEQQFKIPEAIKNFFQNIERIKDTNVKREVFESVLNVILAVELIIGGYFWVQHNSIILAANSEEASDVVAGSHEVSPKKDEVEPETSKIPLVDRNVPSKYSDQLKKTKCAEDKNDKKSSNLCGKDQEVPKEIKKTTAKNQSAKKAAVRRGPIPYSYKVAGGKLVCEKKNDHPKKSKRNKKGHMDMECCLDPDEVPNPNCTYS